MEAMQGVLLRRQRKDLWLEVLLLIDREVHEAADHDDIYYIEETDALDLIEDDAQEKSNEV